jgi:hypothetical protein
MLNAECRAGLHGETAKADGLAERITGWICTWRDHLRKPEEAELPVAMRQRENAGRPLGNSDFVRRLGVLLGPDLLPNKPGPSGPRRETPYFIRSGV